MASSPSDSDSHASPRPGDLARVLLAGSSGPPRARARDQQADLAGEALRKEVLHRVILLDPEPEDLEATLLSIVAGLGEPTGPTRAIGLTILQEWEMVLANSGYWSFLIGEALQGDARSRERQNPRPDQTGTRE
jgi:hypothetical protein